MIFPFRLVPTPQDKAPPGAVTLPSPAFRTARAYPRPEGLSRLGIKNDLHAASHTAEPTRTARRVGSYAQLQAIVQSRRAHGEQPGGQTAPGRGQRCMVEFAGQQLATPRSI